MHGRGIESQSRAELTSAGETGGHAGHARAWPLSRGVLMNTRHVAL